MTCKTPQAPLISYTAALHRCVTCTEICFVCERFTGIPGDVASVSLLDRCTARNGLFTHLLVCVFIYEGGLLGQIL